MFVSFNNFCMHFLEEEGHTHFFHWDFLEWLGSSLSSGEGIDIPPPLNGLTPILTRRLIVYVVST